MLNKTLYEQLNNAKLIFKEQTTEELKRIANSLELAYSFTDDVLLKESIDDVLSLIYSEIHTRKDN